MISKSLMSKAARSSPARTGDTRYLALPARLTIPLALEYSSLLNRSVIVARKEGSSKDEKMELMDTPMQIMARLACPFSIQIKINRMPIAEKPSPAIIKSLLSKRSAKTPAGMLSSSVGRNASKVISAILAALCVSWNT